MIRRARLRVLLCVPFLSVAQLPAQVQRSTPDLGALRRDAIVSTLAERTKRSGRALPVSLCSVLQAVGFVDPTLGEAQALRASTVGDTALVRCVLAGAEAGSRIRAPFVEVMRATITPRGPGAVQVATVDLRVWSNSTAFSAEHYEFTVAGPAPWPTLAFSEKCCGDTETSVNLFELPLVVLNGQSMPGISSDSALALVRGQIVDSIRVTGWANSGLDAKYEFLAKQGVVIVTTHPPSRRP